MAKHGNDREPGLPKRPSVGYFRATVDGEAVSSDPGQQYAEDMGGPNKRRLLIADFTRKNEVEHGILISVDAPADFVDVEHELPSSQTVQVTYHVKRPDGVWAAYGATEGLLKVTYSRAEDLLTGTLTLKTEPVDSVDGGDSIVVSDAEFESKLAPLK